MSKRTPPFPEYPEWSTAKVFTHIRGGLRYAWLKWPPRQEVLMRNRRAVTGKRHKWEYQCEMCQEWFKFKEVEIDHIEPCGSFREFTHAGEFIKKMFVGVDKLRRLCKPCHVEVSRKQNLERIERAKQEEKK